MQQRPMLRTGSKVRGTERRIAMEQIGRFAPSPSGRMHLGNVFSAMLAWLSIRSCGGKLVLRIEDLDPDRCRREYADQLKRDLEWLGLTWDEEQTPQSLRSEAYRGMFSRLEEKNAWNCTRRLRPMPRTGRCCMPEPAGI